MAWASMNLAILSLPSEASVLAVAYATVLLAELVGDKSVYTIAALSLKFRPSPVFSGLALAFMGKMLAAVLFGKILLQIPGHLTAILSAACFFACSFLIWLKEPGETSSHQARETGWLRAATVSFSSLFFTEWCDTGQIAAAALAAHGQGILFVWLGGTLALITKGTLAMTVGAKLRSVVPQQLIRTIACLSYAVLGVASLAYVLVP